MKIEALRIGSWYLHHNRLIVKCFLFYETFGGRADILPSVVMWRFITLGDPKQCVWFDLSEDKICSDIEPVDPLFNRYLSLFDTKDLEDSCPGIREVNLHWP